MTTPPSDRPAPAQPFFALAVVVGVAWSTAALLGGALLASWFLAEKTASTWLKLPIVALLAAAYLLPIVAYWKSVRAGAYRRRLALGWKIVSGLTGGFLLLLPLIEASASFGYYAGLLLPLGCWAYGIWLSTKA